MGQKNSALPDRSWHLGTLHFRGERRIPTIIDGRGAVFRVSASRLDSRLRDAANGFLVAFSRDQDCDHVDYARPVTSVERSQWFDLLEKRARRKRKKLVAAEREEALKSYNTLGFIRSNFRVRRTKGPKKRGANRAKSVFSPAQGQTKKVGSHRENTGHA
jgi:hypothetical protein